jgi:predicted Rossmann fold nucleotide-binding protein DprA/Smf involved in DNA uptake
MRLNPTPIQPGMPEYPARWRERLDSDAPAQIFALGNLDLKGSVLEK